MCDIGHFACHSVNCPALLAIVDLVWICFSFGKVVEFWDDNLRLPAHVSWAGLMQLIIGFFSGLDNKVTLYPLILDEDVSLRKKTVGTHTSYMSCCLFPNSDQQVGNIQLKSRFFLWRWFVDSDWQRGFYVRPLGRGIRAAVTKFSRTFRRRDVHRLGPIWDRQHFRLRGR